MLNPHLLITEMHFKQRHILLYRSGSNESLKVTSRKLSEETGTFVGGWVWHTTTFQEDNWQHRVKHHSSEFLPQKRSLQKQVFSSVAQSCLTLCDPIDCSTSGFPVHHQLPELIQTHVHQVSDVIHSSHPLSSPSPPAFNLSQHQGLFKWVSSSHQVAKILGVSASAAVLPMNIQDWFLEDGLIWSPCSPRDSQESSTPQFKSINSSVLGFLYSPTLTSIHD